MLMCRVMVILWTLVYAWNVAKRFRATTCQSVIENGLIVYNVSGPLFFGSTTGFWELLDVANNPTIVIKDLVGTRIGDQLAFQNHFEGWRFCWSINLNSIYEGAS